MLNFIKIVQLLVALILITSQANSRHNLLHCIHCSAQAAMPSVNSSEQSSKYILLILNSTGGVMG